jgi:hypothetical protein
MPTVETTTPRNIRARYRLNVIHGLLPLFILGPSNFPGYAGKSGWFFCAKVGENFVLISKSPVKNRDEARAKAQVFFGRKPSEYRKPTTKKPKAKKELTELAA